MHGGGTEQKKNQYIALADPRGAPGTSPPVKVLSFSCSFRQNICKITPTWELPPSPQENSESATALIYPEKTLWQSRSAIL